MEETKKPWKSWTLWANVAALVYSGLEYAYGFNVIPPVIMIPAMAVANMGLRWLKTKAAIKL